MDHEADRRDDPGVAAGQFLNYTMREPLGVVAGITPPNYPLTMPLYKAAPALATGNTIIIKPSEDTSLVALRLGANCSSKPACPRACSTSSPATAKPPARRSRSTTTSTRSPSPARPKSAALLVRAAAGNLKKVSLELGGKSPNIVFADADLEAALKGVFMGIFFCQGEICSAGSRLFVEQSIYDEFVARLARRWRKRVQLGHGLDPETKMGPLVSREQQERVLGLPAHRHGGEARRPSPAASAPGRRPCRAATSSSRPSSPA